MKDLTQSNDRNSTRPVGTTLETSFELGDWRVDPELNRLTALSRPSTRRNIEPRLMQLLCLLAANPGRVLSREQLTCELWPTVIVNDNSLTRAVSALRKQLRLGPHDDRRYLETIPKKGYRLSVPVRPLAMERSPLQNLPAALGKSVTATSCWLAVTRQPLAWTAVVALSVAAGSGWWAAIRPAPPALVNLSPEPVFDQVNNDQQLPDGGQLSLSSLTGSSGTALPPEPAMLAVSPDGSALAYLRHEFGKSRLYLVQAGSDAGPVAIFSSDDYLYNLQWSPVGNALLFARQPTARVTTLMHSASQPADLVMLDLDRLLLEVLIDNTPETPRSPAAV